MTWKQSQKLIGLHIISVSSVIPFSPLKPVNFDIKGSNRIQIESKAKYETKFGANQTDCSTPAKLPHIKGIFTHFWHEKPGFVTHSLNVTRFADLPLTFETLPIIYLPFCQTFSHWQMRGCEIWAPPKYYWDSYFEKIWFEVCTRIRITSCLIAIMWSDQTNS